MQRNFKQGQKLSIGEEMAQEAVKTAPPAMLAAFTLNEWLLIAGLAWIGIQAFVFIHKYIVWLRETKKEKT